MRVISGEYRHRVLEEVPSDTTRETKDRVKEAMFNSIQPYIYQAKVLDLFAGSGSLGIEAISRGAIEATFVDHDTLAVRVITSNCKSLDIIPQSTIHRMDYQSFLSTVKDPYDVILLDPPYTVDILNDIITTIATQRLLHEDGIIVVLYGKNNHINPNNHGIIEYKKKTMGITNVSFMKWGS